MSFYTKENMGTKNYPAPSVEDKMNLARKLLDTFPEDSVRREFEKIGRQLSREEKDSYYIINNIYTGFVNFFNKTINEASTRISSKDREILRSKLTDIAYFELDVVNDVIELLLNSKINVPEVKKDLDRIYNAIKYDPEIVSHNILFHGTRFLTDMLKYVKLSDSFIEEEKRGTVDEIRSLKTAIVSKVRNKAESKVTKEDRKEVFRREPHSDMKGYIKDKAQNPNFADFLVVLREHGVDAI